MKIVADKQIFYYICTMNRNLKNIHEYHTVIFEKFGINTNGKLYEVCVEELIEKFLLLNKEIHLQEKDRFARELYKPQTERLN